MAVKKSKINSHFLIYVMEGIQKKYLFCQKWYIEGEGVLPQGGASEYNPLFSNT